MLVTKKNRQRQKQTENARNEKNKCIVNLKDKRIQCTIIHKKILTGKNAVNYRGEKL